jgi:hypothetical protein
MTILFSAKVTPEKLVAYASSMMMTFLAHS